MVEINKIYNEDCLSTMSKMENNSIDTILTSPPYNMTKRKGGYADKQPRYDVYRDWKSEDEYVQWTLSLFREFERILKKDGVILYNLSYSIENPSLPFLLVSEIYKNTNLCLGDTIIWKKTNAIPHPASYNRLNRIVEFVFVFCRKKEAKTYKMHKTVKSVGSNGQTYYEIVENFFIAKNNNETTDLNKATYSVEFCDFLLSNYADKGYVIYDPFMGTGTTGVSAVKNRINYIGSEISDKQVEHANKRIENAGKEQNLQPELY